MSLFLDRQMRAVQEILEERDRQLDKWGTEHDLTHDEAEWLALLSIRVGKAHADLIHKPHGYMTLDERKALRRRIVQVGAVALAALTALRQTWDQEDD